jgi:TPR repeat protein
MGPPSAKRILLLVLVVALGVGCSDTDRTRWLARFGSTPAQYALGQRLVTGQGVARDVPAGLEWLEKAADGGSLPAQRLLVSLYDERGEQGDAERAERWLRAAANAGDAASQARLGERLESAGNGGEEAAAWIEKAAAAGDPRGLYLRARGLGEQGAPEDEVVGLLTRAAEAGEPQAAAELVRLAAQGVASIDASQARVWLLTAAEGGNPAAQHALGERFVAGEGDQGPDYETARSWYLRAAEQGYAPAQEAIGILYQGGFGVAKSATEAAKWYRLAADQGRASSQNQLGMLFALGLLPDEETAKEISIYTGLQSSDSVDAQLEQLSARAQANNDRRAAEWYRRAIAQEYAPAMTNLALLIEEGRVPDAEPGEAVALLERAAELGNREASSELAARLLNGDGVDADPERAVAMLKAAAEGGHGPSQLALAQLYVNGVGVEVDAVQAARWYGRAVESGIEQAEAPYAVLLAKGIGVEADESKALELLERASERGESEAQWGLGLFYDEGRAGLRPNPRQAVTWWRRAAEQGHRLAQLRLGVALVRGTGTRKNLEEAYAWLAASGRPEAKAWIDSLEKELTAAMLAKAKKLAAEKSALGARETPAG